MSGVLCYRNHPQSVERLDELEESVWSVMLQKSPTECRAAGRTGRECLECYATEITHRVQSGWTNWKRVSGVFRVQSGWTNWKRVSGVLCYRNHPQSVERLDELEESVWSVMLQKSPTECRAAGRTGRECL